MFKQGNDAQINILKTSQDCNVKNGLEDVRTHADGSVIKLLQGIRWETMTLWTKVVETETETKRTDARKTEEIKITMLGNYSNVEDRQWEVVW